MAWTTPKTWSYKEAPGSESLNDQVRDNMNYLKASLPAGVTMMYGGATAPDQFLLCDGTAVSRSTYAALFAVIGTSYGVGNGSSTFNLPDFRGRVPVGLKATDADFDALGDTFGTKTHTLTTAEMPTHNHGVTDPGHGHSTSYPTDGSNDPVGGNHEICTDYRDSSGNGNKVTVISNTTGISIQNAGSGNAHNNVQPSLVVNFIIKY